MARKSKFSGERPAILDGDATINDVLAELIEYNDLEEVLWCLNELIEERGLVVKFELGKLKKRKK